MKTFKIYTLGCKVNQYDSQAIREQLQSFGCKESNNSKKSDFNIINTCSVTGSADKQSRYLIRVARRNNPSGKIIVTGCYAHSNSKDIRKIKGVDLVLDNEDKERIAKFILPSKKETRVGVFEISDFKSHTRAFVKIQDGCNNFCSFCKVPYVRGRSRSRDFKSIIEEVKRLSDKGYKEIVLTGICLGDYGKSLIQNTGLVALIEEIEKVEKILRIRLSSIEAKDITDRLINKMKTSKKLCSHLHIPFQSGDNKILKLMNRRDTREDYLNLANKLKKNIKGLAITADIMIGFPGEEDKNFSNTFDLLKKIKPSRVHIFTFQPRDGTPLSDCKNSISQDVLKRRFLRLKTLSEKLGLQFRKKFINKKLKILFEDKKDGFWRGYSNNYLLACVKGKTDLLFENKILEVKVKNASATVLSAV
ncbi:tRNA (N(6)-L-threonylcarbamoyladenosine(37)-C(2))-methylthiotransferase MtaB [Candidatus Omnitrophota bacterium]